MSAASLLGAAVSALGSICSNFGVNIQKYSFMKQEDLTESDKVPYYKNKLWMGGLALVIFGSLGDFVALGLAAQSIVAPIGAITLVANIFFAHYWLGEELTTKDTIGTILIVVGSVLAVAFGDHSSKTYEVKDLVDNYKATGFIVYCIILSIITTLMYFGVKFIEPIKMKLLIAMENYNKAEENNNRKAILRADAVLSILEQEYKKYEKIHPFMYCAISGIFGGQNILFGKMVAELIGNSFDGNNQMTNPLTYVFLICMLLSIFTQLHFLAKALNWFDALYVVPVFQCFFITISTLGGAAYFKEFSSFDTSQAIAFPSGIFLTLFGVYLLSSREMSQEIQRNISQYQLVQGDGEGEADQDPASDEAIISKKRRSLLVPHIETSLLNQKEITSTIHNRLPRRSIYAKTYIHEKRKRQQSILPSSIESNNGNEMIELQNMRGTDMPRQDSVSINSLHEKKKKKKNKSMECQRINYDG